MEVDRGEIVVRLAVAIVTRRHIADRQGDTRKLGRDLVVFR
jgi:hypothetical protein